MGLEWYQPWFEPFPILSSNFGTSSPTLAGEQEEPTVSGYKFHIEVASATSGTTTLQIVYFATLAL